MKYLYLIITLVLFSCGMGKKHTNPNMNKLNVNVEIIINNMPSTDVGSKNYAIVTFSASGDTLVENWRLSSFILKNEEGKVLQELTTNELSFEFKGKGSIEQKINVRDLPHTLPNPVSASIVLQSESENEFTFESDPIYLTIVE